MRTDFIYGRVAGNEGVGVTEHEAGKEWIVGYTASNAFERTYTHPYCVFQMCQLCI